jgi:hypothetical protein
MFPVIGFALGACVLAGHERIRASSTVARLPSAAEAETGFELRALLQSSISDL